MNQTEERTKRLDADTCDDGAGVVEVSCSRHGLHISQGRNQPGGQRLNPVNADCLLIYQGKRLANLDELKQSLLQKAFTGQLTATRELVSA